MCSRAEIVERRHCYVCGGTYYGTLGHPGCPGFGERKKKKPKRAKSRKQEKPKISRVTKKKMPSKKRK
ncbi:MAG: hypothetical protein ISR98_02090 [Parcubacteria group bacterium]|nr:hypothetical protein [Parcubacteria group bacterium]